MVEEGFIAIESLLRHQGVYRVPWAAAKAVVERCLMPPKRWVRQYSPCIFIHRGDE